VYAGLQQPATPIPAELTQIHGVSNAMVRGKQLDLGRVQLALSSSQYVVAHNAQFDRKFVESIPGLTIPSWLEWRCSCWGISWKKQVGLRNHKLASVRRHLGISDQGAHEALSDVYVVARLLEHQHLFSSLLGERFEEPTSRPKDWILEIESRMRLFNRPAAGVP
jgi:DNA polymerase-3 subunit epsilon